MADHSPAAQLIELLKYLDGAYAPNTLRAYRADMLEFIAHCEVVGQCALPASAPTVAEFLMKTLEQGIKTSTIRRKVSSISAIHRLSSQEDPTKHPQVKITLRKISRHLGTRFKQAHPINRPLLDRLLSVCGQDLHGLRNRALLLLAYDSMRRRSELVSLRIEDIEWNSDEGISILLRRSKTDQWGTGHWAHLSPESTCAVQDWLEAAEIKKGCILRGIRPNGMTTQSLCETRIPRIFKYLARRALVDEGVVRGISGHSMRVGGAQDLLVQGASIPQIMVRGGWAKTDTVMRYVERIHQRAS